MKSRILLLTIVVMLLITGAVAWYLIPKQTLKNKNVNNSDQTVSGSVVDGNSGKKIEMDNLSGTVKKWNGDSNTLELTTKDGQEKTVVLDPPKTLVLIPKAGNQDYSKPIFVVKKANEYHWNTAFCEWDVVSYLADKSTGTVVNIVNQGYRMCGRKGEI